MKQQKASHLVYYSVDRRPLTVNEDKDDCDKHDVDKLTLALTAFFDSLNDRYLHCFFFVGNVLYLCDCYWPIT